MEEGYNEAIKSVPIRERAAWIGRWRRGKSVSYTHLSFYQGKRVLVTGHTGLKGTWMCRILARCGAKVTGYALNPPTDPSIYQIIGLEETMDSRIGDIRDLEKLRPVFEEVRPEVVFHLAAQPIVRDSYKDPVYTYETNVMAVSYTHLL